MKVQTYEQANREDLVVLTEMVHKLQERAAILAARLDTLKQVTKDQAQNSNDAAFAIGEVIGAILARLDKLETVVVGNDRTFRELIEDNATLAAHLDALDSLISKLEIVVAGGEFLNDTTELTDRLDALEIVQTAHAGLLIQRSRENAALELQVARLRETLTGAAYDARLDALEQTAKDQARNSNASAIAFNDRLDALEKRVAELEKPQVVIPTANSEWVRSQKAKRAEIEMNHETEN